MNDVLEERDWRLLLSAAERAAMLGDIARVSLAVGARLLPESPWTPFGVFPDSDRAAKSPVEQLGFIEHLLPALARTLAQIARSPLADAAVLTRAALPVNARSVRPAAWMTHARQATRHVAETRTTLTRDIPENRAVRSFLNILARDSQAIARLADMDNEPEAAARAAAIAQTLHRLQAHILWDEVIPKRGDWTRPPTAREQRRPDYARLARDREEYRRQFRFNWDCPTLTLPPRETWRLYELWCLLVVLDTLRGLGWNTPDPAAFFAVREGRLLLTLTPGIPSRLTLRSVSGRTLFLTYNQTFTEGRESLSHTMMPDITLSDGRWHWILDAKFKPYAQPGEEGADINQMHAYRDAIVCDGGCRVAAAWCLYAGLTNAPNRPQITYGRRAGDVPVGAHCLRPGDPETLTRLRRLLADWLDRDLPTAVPPPFPET